MKLFDVSLVSDSSNMVKLHGEGSQAHLKYVKGWGEGNVSRQSVPNRDCIGKEGEFVVICSCGDMHKLGRMILS